MTPDQIKSKIAGHFQVQIDNMANTDTLADVLETGEDEDMDRANRLLTDARIEIVWAVGSDAR